MAIEEVHNFHALRVLSASTAAEMSTGLGRVTRKENEGTIFKPASHFHASPHRKELERTRCRVRLYIFGSELLSWATTADADVALDERPVHRGCRTARSIRHWWLVSKVAHMR